MNYQNQFTIAIALIIILSNINIAPAQNWPQWRGPLSTGAAPAGNPPIEWSEQQNVRWKVPIPGTGYSTPIIWDNTIFITAAIAPKSDESSSGNPDSIRRRGRRPVPEIPVKFIVIAVDRTNGEILWERLAREEIPHEGQHPTTTWATGSPVTDGKYLFAYFGSRGLYCYDLKGTLLWEKDFGDLRINSTHGEGATPALYKDRLIVNWDHEDQSFITVLDAATGKEIWKKNRDEVTTWMTPLIVEVDGKDQVITSGTNRIITYNLANGNILWEDNGLTANVIPCPVESDGVVYLTSGHRGSALRAIRLSGASGNISGSPAILWSYNQDTPYVPSPLLHGGLLYFMKSNQGILTCIDIATGKPHYARQRLEGIRSLYASPVGVQDRVYILSREGVMMVLRHGSKFDVLATNTLDDNFDASPVIVGDEMYLRGHEYLYCIARQ